MPTAYLCDFDGTASPRDIGAALVERFSDAASADRRALLEAWRAGRIGHRELTTRECELMRVREDEALAFTRGFALDPDFVPFVAEASARGDRVMVLSEGFGFYVSDRLADAGLADLPWAANRAVFTGDTVRAEFPFADPSCAACGNCKAQHVRAWRARGYRTVLVGDGTSDRHGAQAADAVIARGDLAAWCVHAGIGHRPFERFADLRAGLRPAGAAGAGPRGAR